MYITKRKIRNLIKETINELLKENKNPKQIEGTIKRGGIVIEFISLGEMGGSYYVMLFDGENTRHNVDHFISLVGRGKAKFHGSMTEEIVRGLAKAKSDEKKVHRNGKPVIDRGFSLTTIGKFEVRTQPLSQEAKNILIVALDLAGIAGDVSPLTMGPAIWANFQAGVMKLESDPPDEFGAFVSFISMAPVAGDAIGVILRLIRAALEGADNVPEAIQAWRDSGMLDSGEDTSAIDDTAISPIISHEEYEKQAKRIYPEKEFYINTLNDMLVDYKDKDVIIANQIDMWEQLFGPIQSQTRSAIPTEAPL